MRRIISLRSGAEVLHLIKYATPNASDAVEAAPTGLISLRRDPDGLASPCGREEDNELWP